MKVCKYCKGEIKNKRRDFCEEICRFRYWSIKNHNEKHLPTLKKRNRLFFYMYMGTKMKKGQGKRCGSMVTGAMSIGTEPIFKVELATFCNLYKHFKHSQSVKVAELCDKSVIKRHDFFKEKQR